MSGAGHEDRERSYVIAQRANELMRDYGSSASPRAYAVWYNYVSGRQPLMNTAIKRLTTQSGSLSDGDIDDLYEAHIDGRNVEGELDRHNAGLITEVQGIMEMIDLSLGSTAQYGASLQAISKDLADTTPNRLKDIVATLIVNTCEVAASNRTLEAHMRESRREIETLRETLAAARLESLTDPLTGLSNRKHFEEMLCKEIDEGAKSHQPASLILIDIDFFKRFNDLFGHLTGDQVLRLVAVVMRETVSARATLSRFGGEEFGILLPGIGRDAARIVAEAVRTSIMGRDLVKRATGESLGKVTISLGVAQRRPDDTMVSFIERADSCLYAGKRAGRNRTIDDGELSEFSEVA
ncbi:GGDEF domain-containing protein [Methylobacterium haplocladii]|uniref:diguanylate cyclase n=1 Tax=Methylobacterium haplocladii TaxID=1176176 RepID=A0A512ITM2_9HYPH|nr:GGDEF domain-containing protein [Methylobacterium haplocladii]GEP01047.1 GGDEF domain-containing protein [Methylobacterium haplocladii]GJD83197.1 Diguanylate cyclase VdcA [Methylobacterium haplocladii]GLS60581.1 GGDEF domain-containing protein [Methylobacterium haplocladii]